MKKSSVRVILMGLLAVFSCEAYSQMIVPAHIRVVPVPEQGFYAIEIEGGIGVVTADEFNEAMDSIPEGEKVVLNLDSRGGYNAVADEMEARILQERAQGRRIDTWVQPGSECGSICVFLFMLGENRRASGATTWYFHPVTDVYTNAPVPDLTRELLQRLESLGVSGEFLNYLEEQGVFTTPGQYWLTGFELMQLGSNIITDEIPRHRVQEIRDLPFDPRMGGPR